MNSLTFTLLIWVGSLLGGYLGSLVGLGGGVVVVPLLTLIFRVDIHYAIGAALVSVIATSSGAAAAYVREGYSNVRVGMFLEMATTTGALVGAALVLYLHATLISIIFGVVLLYSAYTSMRPIPEVPHDVPPDKLATWLRMDSTYPEGGRLEKYHVRNVPGGFGIMFLAGILSGLLGIGSGAVKVLAMDKAMKLPFKVSTTTSNFMIGVTAAAGAGIYLSRGYIDPGLAMPVMLGVLAGSFAGARTLAKARVGVLRLVFAVVIAVMAVEMIYSGFMGRM
ncbi:MAG TPA: sulfite exporter TauE/SafE family protein [Candidatus Acidoferrales bacterium]|nr:sulfite exporter TauE/SafE family protein [Candidatus Acidoferrales bacterium]